MSASLQPGNFGQSEQDWFGGRDDEAEAAASKSLAATAARIVGAKPFPIAAKRLEELTRTSNARIEQVVVVLESDPALSARLLRLVNSAGYGLKVRCTSVRHAAVLVGTRRLNQVATTAAILDLFESSNALAAELLEHAAIVGSLCRYLAVHLGLPHDELFTCGFLHDIGKIMLLDTEREVYPALLREYGGNADSVHEQERRVFGFDHATLGAHVLTAWNIPEPVPKVIAWHHQPARAMQDSVLSAMVQTLRLADLLAYELGRRSDQEGIPLVAASEAAQYLDISEPQLASMWADLAALRDRSKARSHGEPDLEVAEPRMEVPNSLRPRGSLSPRSLKASIAPTHGSIIPKDSDPPGSVRPGSEGSNKDLPNKLACVVCAGGSYGNLCQACGGHVCPNHQEGADEWCSLCQDEFAEFKSTYRLPPSALTGAAAVVSLTLIGSFASAWSSGNTGFTSLLAPLLMSVMWAIVLPIASKLWVKLRFMRGLKPRQPPQRAIDTSGQQLMKEEGQDMLTSEAQMDLPSMPSVIPEYDRTTLHGSVAPPIEPFAAGLLGMLPPAESLPPSAPVTKSTPSVTSVSEPPPSARGPMVIRVDVPSLTPATVMPRGDGSLPPADGQLSAMARLGVYASTPPRSEHDDESGQISSVMPSAAAQGPSVVPSASPTPASMVPSSEGPEIHVGVLSMPHLRVEPEAPAPAPQPVVEEPAPAPVPVQVAAPEPAPAVATPTPVVVPADDVSAVASLDAMANAAAMRAAAADAGHPDEDSGVRHVLLRNEPGVLREVCSPVVYNRCS